MNTYYTAWNRIFTTYTDAVNYCLECDFDPDTMIETIEED